MTTTTPQTPRERFIAGLERRPFPGLIPTFELVFYLTMEAFGRVHPLHRHFDQWMQMTPRERDLHRRDMADVLIHTANYYGHDAIFLHPKPETLDETLRQIDTVRAMTGDRFFLIAHGDATLPIPSGAEMESMSLRMAEEPEAVESEAQRSLDRALERADTLRDHGGLDALMLCSDYCFNSGPFLPLPWFDRFVTPFLHELVAGYRQKGFYVIKHTDGNIMPILDRLVPDNPDARPHALHSLDPQGDVDLEEIVSLVGDKVALCGNVNCGLLQTGSQEQCAADVQRSIRQGMKAPGYIFCTSNTVYTGMPLERYDAMMAIYREQAIRPDDPAMD
ncbi:uroporphyrinogen decarboxylase family protein [Mucisphaera calidilacus]|uniref:Methylcobalamin:coenzyme M methyltransferase n=1 Tax=Mucisphaera calidilacus TaxID=2527982 RepID=A0A518BTT7_9BACT|nr:uroporphyrinogen decarboxylase family protein [Mucisphaera calidilacus]QDU70386.1 methylcobalamin:coenzyme M methyltransferase [Mucisphaera calidilacus]